MIKKFQNFIEWNDNYRVIPGTEPAQRAWPMRHRKATSPGARKGPGQASPGGPVVGATGGHVLIGNHLTPSLIHKILQVGTRVVPALKP